MNASVDTNGPVQGSSDIRVFYRAHYDFGIVKEFHVHGSQLAVKEAQSWANPNASLIYVDRVIEKRGEQAVKEEVWTKNGGFKK